MAGKEKEGYINGRRLRPESLMMSYGYNPEWSEGSVKCPIFQTSTFAFKSAEDGKAFFELAYGLREQEPQEQMGLIYSRLNNPDLEILEDRLTLWDEAEQAAAFESGMAAIATLMFEFLNPGDVVLHSDPLYGGTEYLLNDILPRFNIKPVGFRAGTGREGLEMLIEDEKIAEKLALIFIETPANPTNALVDMRMCADLVEKYSADDRKILFAVDNTFLGPLFQHPLKHGADLVLYSATKYIGGHSDLVAGACLGPADLMKRIKMLRTVMGNMAGPWTGWLLLRSLETLKMRMVAQMKNARYVADYLADHPKVERVHYLGHLTENDPQFETYRRQCLAPGAMVSFDMAGGEAECYRFLNSLELFRLAVSLGGTESLAEHPGTMTHSDIPPDEQCQMGISPKMIRLSIGVEYPPDLIADLEQAFSKV